MTTDPRAEKVATFALAGALLLAAMTGGFATHAAFTDEGTVAVNFGVAAVNGNAATNTGGGMDAGTAATNRGGGPDTGTPATNSQSIDGDGGMGGLVLPSSTALLAPAVAIRTPDGAA
ncbi:MAG: hypothetical protein V5A46_01875 [Haloferacaceae archaeon]